MAFLNKKEQVIKLEMTPYGRHLYSTGRFKPVFYEFYDDDIIYDKRYAEVSFKNVAGDGKGEVMNNLYGPEAQNDIIPRITGTIVNDVQHNFKNLDNKRTVQTSDYEDFCLSVIENHPQILSAEQLFSEKEYSMGLPLGTAEHANEYAPAWDVQLLKGEVVEFQENIDITNQIKVPQLEVDIKLDLYHSYDDEGQKKFFLRKDNLLLEVDELNSVDIVEDEFEAELFLENVNSEKKELTEPTGAKLQIIVSGTYEGTTEGAQVEEGVGEPYYGPGPAATGGLTTLLPHGEALTTTGTLVSKFAFSQNTGDVYDSKITLKSAAGTSLREIIIIPNSFSPVKASTPFPIDMRVRESQFGYSEYLKNIMTTGYWAFEGGDIIDFTKNLAGAINLPNVTNGYTHFKATHTIDETGTDGSSTWSAITGTITIETAKVGVGANSFSLTATEVTGTSVKNADSPGTSYYHETTFAGATAATSDHIREDKLLIYELIKGRARTGFPKFEIYGDFETFPTNLKALREIAPWLWYEDKATYQKFYFSDDPQSALSQKFANYYFDILSDSEIPETDFCDARIFDDHKSLYVSGYVKCTPTKIENIDLYDQSESDEGEPC